MTLPKSAIEKAIAGGWMAGYQFGISEFSHKEFIFNADGNTTEEQVKAQSGLLYFIKCWEGVALDPTFWSALGKSLGWEKGEPFTYERETKLHSGKYVQATRMPNPRKNAYMAYARRFYDLILTNGDLSAFWEELGLN